MRILKNILIFIVAFVAIVLISALFIKKDFEIHRSVTISKPKQQVFDFIKLLNNQDKFSIWAQKDPHMKKSFSGVDGSIGATQYWEGNSDVGKSEQEIVNIVDGDRIDFELRFKNPWEATMPAYMKTESETENSTKVSWGMNGTSPYPWNIMNLFNDKMFGNDLQAGLDNLKKLLEGSAM